MQTHTCDVDSGGAPLTGMGRGILSELADKLTHFAETGETEILSLRAMPLTQADIDWLQTYLGAGEVRVELDVAGHSEIFETTFPGIWWVRHFSGDDIASEELHVTDIPQIIRTHPKDAAAAARALTRALQDEAEQNEQGGRHG